MTVKELIEKLQKCSKDDRVIFVPMNTIENAQHYKETGELAEDLEYEVVSLLGMTFITEKLYRGVEEQDNE